MKNDGRGRRSTGNIGKRVIFNTHDVPGSLTLAHLVIINKEKKGGRDASWNIMESCFM